MARSMAARACGLFFQQVEPTSPASGSDDVARIRLGQLFQPGKAHLLQAGNHGWTYALDLHV